MATGFNPSLQHAGGAGKVRFEFGAGDWTTMCLTTNGNQSQGVATGMNYIYAGFLVARDASDAYRIGCITSQHVTSSAIEFTYDDSAEGLNYYWIWGY